MKKNCEFSIVDGYTINNTSIISLIQRKVKKIICFNSVQHQIDKSSNTNLIRMTISIRAEAQKKFGWKCRQNDLKDQMLS